MTKRGIKVLRGEVIEDNPVPSISIKRGELRFLLSMAKLGSRKAATPERNFKFVQELEDKYLNGVETNKVQPKCSQCKTDTLTNGWFSMCDDCVKILHG